MSDNSSIEEQFRISKSSMSQYVVSGLVFEYVLAQNEKKNPKGYKFLLGIEQLAKETVNTFGLPNNVQDLDQMNQDFMNKVISAIRSGLLES